MDVSSKAKPTSNKNRESIIPCLHFADPVLLGGVGDIVLSILVLMIRSEAEKVPIRTVFVSASQAAKVRFLILIVRSQLPSLACTLEPTHVVEISDDLLKSMTKKLQDYSPSASVWGPRFFLSDAINSNTLFSVWPGASSSLGEVLDTSSSWSSSYIRYAFHKDAVQEIFDVDSTSINNATSDLAFMSLTANSFSVDQSGVVSVLAQALLGLEISLNRVIYNTILTPQERPDIIKKPGEHGSTDSSCINQLSIFAKEWTTVTDLPFSQMVAHIQASDILISFRSGLTDLAALLGKRLLTIYPSMQEFSWFKISPREHIVVSGSQYVITYCSPSLSADNILQLARA